MAVECHPLDKLDEFNKQLQSAKKGVWAQYTEVDEVVMANNLVHFDLCLADEIIDGCGTYLATVSGSELSCC